MELFIVVIVIILVIVIANRAGSGGQIRRYYGVRKCPHCKNKIPVRSSV
ncbi:hypothetical protein [Bradyrhizobium sp. 5.13L]